MNKWNQGHIDPWWNFQHRDLEYFYLPYKDSSTVELWRSQGYTNSNFGGGIYGMTRGLPDWAERFHTVFENWTNKGIAIYSMGTGDLLPTHVDHYSTYIEKFNARPTDIWRAVIFLEDWKSGHYFEIDGQPLMPWRAGDWVSWNNDVPHAAANIGTQNRYTVQITGTEHALNR